MTSLLEFVTPLPKNFMYNDYLCLFAHVLSAICIKHDKVGNNKDNRIVIFI